MQERNSRQGIEEITIKIIDLALIIGSILGALTFFISLIYYSSDSLIFYISDFLVVSSFIGITIFRKKIRIEIKTLIILIGIFILILTDVIKVGISSDNKILMILIPFLSYLVYSYRKTVIIYSFSMLVFLFLGYLHITGIVSVSAKFASRGLMISPWLENVLLITVVSSVIIIILSKYNRTYTSLINNLEKSNKKISEQERNYREIFNSSTDAIFIHNLDGKILDVNDSMLKMYGYERTDIGNIDIAELSSGKEGFTANDAGEFVYKTIQGEPQVFDWQAKKKNGEYFWVEVALKKTNLAGSDRVLAIIRDINEKKEDALQLVLYRNHLKELVAKRTNELEQANEELHTTNDNLALQKEELHTTNNNLALQKEELVTAVDELQKTQEQLIQSEKMASLGILATGVAHEINNPLNFIQGGLFGLENYFEEELKDHQENVKPLLHGISVGIERASDIVTSLNHYSRTDNSKTEKCDIHGIIDDSLFMLHNKIKNKVEIHKEFTNTEFILLGNKGQLHQLIINVLLNAVQAISKKGVISIGTEVENSELKLSVKDTGSGISKENLSKIFDPFFTTKEVGEGTGLGMSISLKIIEDHNGKIKYKSEINKGTEAIITLPLKK